MKYYLLLIIVFLTLGAQAQNTGIGLNNPSEIFHVDSTIKIGKNQTIPDSTRKNLLKFGDGAYVTIGEEFVDDQMNIKFGDLIFSKSQFSNGNGYIGILTNTPSANLDLNGSLRIRNANASANRVLTCLDGNGNATWSTVPPLTLPFSGSTAAASTAFKILETGTGFGAVDFEITNTANPVNALFTNSAGTGSTIFSQKSGTAGSAIIATVTDNTNTSPSMNIDTYGSGDVITAVARGTGIGARVLVNNVANTANALVVSTNGSGIPLYVNAGSSSSNVASFSTNNSLVAQIDKTGKGIFYGGVRIQNGNEGANKILTATDGLGNTDWQPMSTFMPAFRAYMTSNVSVTSATTTVTGYTENYDDAAAFNAATGIYTVPATGLYSFSATAAWLSTAAGNNVAYGCRISVNYSGGGNTYVSQVSVPSTTLAGYGISLNTGGEMKLSVGDQVRLEVFHSFGSSIVLSGGGNITTSFGGHRVY